MRTLRKLRIVGLALVLAPLCLGTLVMPFNSLVDWADRADDILLVRCVSAVPPELHQVPGLNVYVVDSLRSLKGVEMRERLQVAALLGQMMPGQRYLTFCFGQVHDPNRMRIDNGQISPVHVPDSFRLEDLEGKNVRQQVRTILLARRTEIDRLMQDLKREAQTIDRGLDAPGGPVPGYGR